MTVDKETLNKQITALIARLSSSHGERKDNGHQSVIDACDVVCSDTVMADG